MRERNDLLGIYLSLVPRDCVGKGNEGVGKVEPLLVTQPLRTLECYKAT